MKLLDSIKAKLPVVTTYIRNNFKMILIVLLSIFLVISFLFRPKVDNTYLTKIKALEQQNDSTMKVNDSLNKANLVLQNEAKHLQDTIITNIGIMKRRDSIIYVFNKKENETRNFVNNLGADSVASQLTDYLQRHR